MPADTTVCRRARRMSTLQQQQQQKQSRWMEAPARQQKKQYAMLQGYPAAALHQCHNNTSCYG
jgi:hypothetical protein